MNLRRLAGFSTLLLAGVLACGTSSEPIAPESYSLLQAADSIPLQAGKSVVVGDRRITFTGVESDSRCPIDAICVHAGDATAVLAVEAYCPGDQSCRTPSVQLRLNANRDPRSGEALGLAIRLVALTPIPTSTGDVPRLGGYTAWLRVQQASK